MHGDPNDCLLLFINENERGIIKNKIFRFFKKKYSLF